MSIVTIRRTQYLAAAVLAALAVFVGVTPGVEMPHRLILSGALAALALFLSPLSEWFRLEPDHDGPR